jgi:hypothetical protein
LDHPVDQAGIAKPNFTFSSLFSPFYTFSSLNLQPIQTLNQKNNPKQPLRKGEDPSFLAIETRLKKCDV